MFIAIISDIHNNLDNLKKCLFWCSDNKVEKIICCGDVADLNTMTYLAQNFSGEIFVVEGNAETYREADLGIFPNIN